jgi:hypothetical protein
MVEVRECKAVIRNRKLRKELRENEQKASLFERIVNSELNKFVKDKANNNLIRKLKIYKKFYRDIDGSYTSLDYITYLNILRNNEHSYNKTLIAQIRHPRYEWANIYFFPLRGMRTADYNLKIDIIVKSRDFMPYAERIAKYYELEKLGNAEIVKCFEA